MLSRGTPPGSGCGCSNAEWAHTNLYQYHPIWNFQYPGKVIRTSRNIFPIIPHLHYSYLVWSLFLEKIPFLILRIIDSDKLTIRLFSVFVEAGRVYMLRGESLGIHYCEWPVCDGIGKWSPDAASRLSNQ